MTDPNSMSSIADRSNSFVAQAYISSKLLGRVPASKRPSARVGAWLHASRPAIPVTASAPCTRWRWVSIFVGSVNWTTGSSPTPRNATDITSRSTVGKLSRPNSLLTAEEVGNCTDPAISNRYPSNSSTVEAIPPA
ncbi:Uncharacterised protein [Mycobacterium tuberculosis]|uniref:Uncharacterized protein n=1 Tax=Mycobacterium tuberculosis TaxID=1773 RepID=A0A654U024_MYCTX|nr:Uncharacterised protein [Mycobacterium tuberculosis]